MNVSQFFHVYLSVCLRLRMVISNSAYLSVFLDVYVMLRICMSIYPPVYLYVNLFICLVVWLSHHFLICLSQQPS